MMAHFLTGWTATTEFIALLGGALCAVLVTVLAIAIAFGLLTFALDAAFDASTNALARRWEKKGRRPAGRWAKIIAKSRTRKE